MVFRKITIMKIRQSREPDVNEMLQAIGASLGLFSVRDKDKSCFRIFITLMHGMREGLDFSSDDIAAMTGLSRGTVIHHLNKLMESGIVEYDHGRYILTFSSVEELVERVERNVYRTLEGLRVTAKTVDGRLDL